MATSVTTVPAPSAPAPARHAGAGAAAANGRSGWTGVAAVTFIALVARLIQLDHPLFIDELNHVMAARSLLTDGTLSVASDEPYVRARVFTYLIALVFRVFGESLVAARVPAVLAGTALVGLIFWWIRRHAGALAAWIAALLLCFYPMSLFLSQIVRFYTLQTLLFWLAVILVYEWVSRRPEPRRAVAYGLGVAACLVLATHLFPLTVVGAAGLAAWAIPLQQRSIVHWYRADRRHRRLLAGVGAVIVAYVTWWALSGGAAWAWTLFNHADLWAATSRHNVFYYHDVFVMQYGSVWTLLPFVALLAVFVKPRPALLCLSIFALAFVFHSVAAWKSVRYIYYAMPAFFAVSGIAVAAVMSAFHRRAQAFAQRAFGGRVPRGVVTAVLVALLLVSVRASFATNHAFRSARVILTSPAGQRPPPYTPSDWRGITAHVRPLIAEGAIVVTSANLKSLYYLNRLDYDLSALHLNDIAGAQPEFAIHLKTGRPVISEPASLERVMQCYPHGVVLIDLPDWRDGMALPAATRDFIADRLARLPLPEASGVIGFEWRGDAAAAATDACPPAR